MTVLVGRSLQRQLLGSVLRQSTYLNGPKIDLNYALTSALNGIETFTRSSLATQYDSTGKLIYAPHNLAFWSEDFASGAILNEHVTLSTPDSINSPTGSPWQRLTSDNNTWVHAHHSQAVNTKPAAAQTYVWSVYCRDGGTNRYIFLGSGNSTDHVGGAIFDTQTHTYTGNFVDAQAGGGVPTNGTLVSTSVQQISSGVWRYSATITVGAGVTSFGVAVGLASATLINYSGATTQYADFSGLQLERLISASGGPGTYNKTTSGAYYGPRFDFDPATLAARGLLTEESRTNLALQSNQFDTTWAALSVQGNVVAAAGTSPDGSNNAWKLREATTTAGVHGVVQNITKAANALPYAGTIFFQSAERNWAFISIGDNVSSGNTVYFNVATGTVGSNVASGAGFTSVSGQIQKVGNSGWYRCTVLATSNAGTQIQMQAGVASGDGINSYAGTVGSGIQIYGAQLEQASFASSYIPTTTAAVTRAADSDIITLSSVGITANPIGITWIGKGRTAKGVAPSVNQTFGHIDDTTNNNRFTVYRNSSRVMLAEVYSGSGTLVASLNLGTVADDTDFAFWFCLAPNDYAAGLVGGSTVTDTAGPMPTGLVMKRAGHYINGQVIDGTISRDMTYMRRLTNAEAAAKAAAL